MKQAKRRKIRKSIIYAILLFFVIMNVVAFMHAYHFTHFSNDTLLTKTLKPEQLSFTQKLKALLFGVNNPRPKNTALPQKPYQNIVLNSNVNIACWEISPEHKAKGTVIFFHGYGSNKSDMIERSTIFDSLGYHTLLVDFMGSGASEGNTTTIGFKEAQQVKTAFDYVQTNGANNIYLFGTSLGAAAIMKAMQDYTLSAAGLMLECPFGTMYKTVTARFDNMNLPHFPMAPLLVFWGGVQNGFWAFNHNPETYAKSTQCPTLLLYGEQDKNVSMQETQNIYNNFKGKKMLKTYPLAGHENYLKKYRAEWINDVQTFLNQNQKP